MNPNLAPLLVTAPGLLHRDGPTYEERLRGWLIDSDTRQVIAASYVAQLEAFEKIGLLRPRERTRILLRPADGFRRTDAEAILRSHRRVRGLEVRQLKAGAEAFLPHLKVCHFDHSTLGRTAILGSSNLTCAGIGKNLEVNALVTSEFGGFDVLTATLEKLWDDYSEPVRPSDFTEEIWEDQRGPSGRHLLPFQRRALDDLTTYFDQVRGQGGAILSLPTGTGKTVIAARFLLERVLHTPTTRVLWVAPQRELAVQAAATFAQQHGFFRMPHLQVEPVSVVRDGDERRRLQSDYNVIFRVLHTAASDPAGAKFDVVVVDEAHWGASESRAMLPRLLDGLDVRFRLGLTATPFRRIASDMELMRAKFPKHISASEDIDAATDAAGRRVLARPVHHRVPTGIVIRFDPAKVAAYVDDQQALLEIKDEARNQLVAKSWSREKYGVTLVFAYDVEHAHLLAAAFNERHPSAKVQVLHTREIPDDLELVVRPVDGRPLAEEQRESIYQRFRGGAIDVLISVNLYVAGVDFPRVQTLFMARPTLSPVLYTQMLGRGRRGEAFGGTESVNVVDFADQLEAHGALSDRLMNLATVQTFDRARAERYSRWGKLDAALHAREPVADALRRVGTPAWFRVITGSNFLRKRLSRTEDLGGHLARLVAGEGPVLARQFVEYWRIEPRVDLAELELLIREYSPDDAYREDSVTPARGTRPRTPLKSSASTAIPPDINTKKRPVLSDKAAKALSAAAQVYSAAGSAPRQPRTRRRRS